MEIKKIFNNETSYLKHSLIVSKLKDKIKNYQNLEIILSELPKGSILVGGFIRDLILDLSLIHI